MVSNKPDSNFYCPVCKSIQECTLISGSTMKNPTLTIQHSKCGAKWDYNIMSGKTTLYPKTPSLHETS